MLEPSQRNGCKSFIDFKGINITDLHASALQRAVCGKERFFQHDDRIARRDGEIMDTRNGRQAMFFERLFRHDQNGRSPITNLR